MKRKHASHKKNHGSTVSSTALVTVRRSRSHKHTSTIGGQKCSAYDSSKKGDGTYERAYQCAALRIRLLVMRGTYVVDIYPAHMWAHAYRSAVQEAIYTNLSIVGMEITT